MPTNITADKIIGRQMYAKRIVDGYNLPDKPNRVIKTYTAGQLIGNVYSWVEKSDGLYWVFYSGTSNVPVYIKHVIGAIEVPDLPQIIEEINRKKEQEQIDRLGPVNYYIKKYLPWIVGAIAVSFILPAIRKK
jgi:hypothetical protein